MKRSALLHYAVIGAAVSLCGPALADNCSGHYSQVVTQFQSIDLGGGHKLDMFMTKTTSDSTDSGYTGTGQCTGYALTTPDGKVRVAGICGRKNKDGSWSDVWGLEPGADRGTWKLVGAGGTYSGKSSAGWWKELSSEGGVAVGKWGGNCN